MLELIFQGFAEWAYELVLECWEYFSTALLDIMSMDYAYMKSHVPVMDDIIQVLMAVGWALLIGNLVFQALKSMMSGLGFEGEDPKLLFTRSFVFSFLLLASPQICEIGLSITARIIDLLQVPTAVHVTLVDKSVFGTLTASWLLAILFGIIIIFKTLRLLLEIAERYIILAVLTMTAPLAFAMGGSKSTADIFSGWCRMYGSMCLLIWQYVSADGDECDLLQNASVCPLHSAKRAGCISVDRADPDPRKGRKKGGCHHHPHWVESGHHRRLSRAAAARRTDLHGCALGGLAHYQECWEVCRRQRQRLLLRRFSERQRPTHGRTVRRRPLCRIYCKRLLSESTAAKRTARGRRASLRLPQRHGSDGRSADSLAGT